MLLISYKIVFNLMFWIKNIYLECGLIHYSNSIHFSKFQEYTSRSNWIDRIMFAHWKNLVNKYNSIIICKWYQYPLQMDRIQEEITENSRFLRPFKLSGGSLRTFDNFLNLMNYALRMCWTFCLCFWFLALIVLEIWYSQIFLLFLTH